LNSVLNNQNIIIIIIIIYIIKTKIYFNYYIYFFVVGFLFFFCISFGSVIVLYLNIRVSLEFYLVFSSPNMNEKDLSFVAVFFIFLFLTLPFLLA